MNCWPNAGSSIRPTTSAFWAGVDANIVVLYGADFPTGSHKVGPAYSCLREGILDGLAGHRHGVQVGGHDLLPVGAPRAAAGEARGAVLLVSPWVPQGQAYFHRRGRIEALRAAGCGQILAVDVDPAKLELATKLGADMVILGISPRQGLSAAFASHTTEKVMEKITVDVVAIN